MCSVTYVVSHLEEVGETWLHVVVVESHECRIHGDTERNEQVNKRVEYD